MQKSRRTVAPLQYDAPVIQWSLLLPGAKRCRLARLFSESWCPANASVGTDPHLSIRAKVIIAQEDMGICLIALGVCWLLLLLFLLLFPALY
jgi:hypothetical protein